MYEATGTQTLNLGGLLPDSSAPAAGITHASITVGGDVSGQIAAGHHIVQLQIGTMHGNVVMPEPNTPQVRRRPFPLHLLPRRPVTFLDREAPTATSLEALAGELSVSVSGQQGVGKSTFLRRLAHQPALADGGVAHLSVRGLARDDVLQQLFDLCYETDRPYRPGPAQLRHLLQDVRDTLLLDDVDLDAEQFAQVLDHCPVGRFVVASQRPILPDGVQSVALSGLPSAEAVELALSVIARPLPAQERAEVTRLCAGLEGIPRQLVQASAAVRDGRVRLEAALDAETAVRAQAPAQSEEDSRLLAVLGAVAGVRLGADDLRLICDITDAEQRLARLAGAGLVQVSADPGGPLEVYELDPDLAGQLPEADLALGRDRLREFLTLWAAGSAEGSSAPRRLAAGLDLLEALAATEQWSEVLSLSRALDPHLALSGRWETWRRALNLQLSAATARTDPAARAFALHQLGTCALCLADPVRARAQLTEALQLRLAYHDLLGAQVTQHNLDFLDPPPPPPAHRQPNPDPGPDEPRRRGFGRPVAGLLLAVTAVIAGLLALPGPRGELIRRLDSATPIVTPSGTQTSSSTPAEVTLTLPPRKVQEATGPKGAAVTYQASARDPSAADVPVTCDHRSGSTFALGRTPVTCRVHRDGVPDTVGTFAVTVRDTRAPQLTVPPAISVPQAVFRRVLTTKAMTAVTWTASAHDTVSGDVPVVCTPASGSLFPLGDTVVTCTAQDGAGNVGTRAFTVTVLDVTPPLLILPADFSVSVNSAVDYVKQGLQASDAVDGVLTPSCDPADGTTFSTVGTVQVTCRVSDRSGNEAKGTFTVTVNSGVILR